MKKNFIIKMKLYIHEIIVLPCALCAHFIAPLFASQFLLDALEDVGVLIKHVHEDRLHDPACRDALEGLHEGGRRGSIPAG